MVQDTALSEKKNVHDSKKWTMYHAGKEGNPTGGSLSYFLELAQIAGLSQELSTF